MIIGFTGTRKGMTLLQKEIFKKKLSSFNCVSFHHGDCVGADKEANDIAKLFPCDVIEINIHPPICNKKRAYCKGTYTYPTKPYLIRNRDIVNCSDLLIVCPSGKEVLRSGTWATVRYARGIGKSIIIIYPNGDVMFK